MQQRKIIKHKIIIHISLRMKSIMPYFDSTNTEMKPTTYCRRFNIAMIWALGLCAEFVWIAVLALIYYTKTFAI